MARKDSPTVPTVLNSIDDAAATSRDVLFRRHQVEALGALRAFLALILGDLNVRAAAQDTQRGRDEAGFAVERGLDM
eukprot:1365153-Amorphochlora_amoeboformis.AAC.2